MNSDGPVFPAERLLAERPWRGLVLFFLEVLNGGGVSMTGDGWW